MQATVNAQFGQRSRLGFIFFLIGIVGMIGSALMYAFTPHFFSYHAKAISMGWEGLPKAEQQLILAYLHSNGVMALAAASGALWILMVPLRQGHPWARHALLSIGFIVALPQMWVMYQLQQQTPANPPIAGVGLLIPLFLLGFAFSAPRSGG